MDIDKDDGEREQWLVMLQFPDGIWYKSASQEVIYALTNILT